MINGNREKPTSHENSSEDMNMHISLSHEYACLSLSCSGISYTPYIHIIINFGCSITFHNLCIGCTFIQLHTDTQPVMGAQPWKINPPPLELSPQLTLDHSQNF